MNESIDPRAPWSGGADWRRAHDELDLIERLVDSRATVAGDPVRIGVTSWAIHGSIPVDGDVLIARYESQEEALRVLDGLAPNIVDGGMS